MLETEEFDEDYFTPVASASLANIFGRSVTDERSDNESLKYVPPKPQNVSQQPEDSKTTSCVFACALVGYEWHNNVYSQKGKLGFALIKVIKSGLHNIILYDSNKTTLSNTSVSNNLKVTVKNNNYISYYDDQTKYWSLYGTDDAIVKVVNLLKMLEVTIITENKPTDMKPPEVIKENEAIFKEQSKKNAGSDTDSSVNRKTKASILNRMANMGQSVLPPKALATDKTSDSSDNNTDLQIKAVRHKSTKGIIRKCSADKLTEHQQIIEIGSNPAKLGHVTDIKSTNILSSDQLVPLSYTTTLSSPTTNDMNLFITEQRVNNSELRINLGRITDKVDNVLNKINDLELKNQTAHSANMNNEILNKLLREYENKIKVYEDLIKQMGLTQSMKVTSCGNISNEIEESLNSKIHILENEVKKRDTLVLNLEDEVKNVTHSKEQQKSDLHKNISDLKEEITANKILLEELAEANKRLSIKQSTESNVSEKLKSLMNETYHTVASNFENENTYSGETIKKTIGLVIRKITLGAINETD